MIVIINGPVGVGKTSVSWELAAMLDKSVMLDGDFIGAVHPFTIYDDARVDYLYETLAHLIAFHKDKGGYRNFVVNYVFETPETILRLKGMLSSPDTNIRAFRLTASEDAIRKRIESRDNAQASWELERFRELEAIFNRNDRNEALGRLIDTTDKTAAGVAEDIYHIIGQTGS